MGHGLIAVLVVQLAVAAGFHLVGSDPTAGQRMLVFLTLILPAWAIAGASALIPLMWGAAKMKPKKKPATTNTPTPASWR